ncbi:MAG TPA: hypothetical protein PKD79_00210 [Candidatus Doudnabacteria bacterium]|nr:hypothetical protein [Candidatus Doudnabacteria bacterium]
MTDVIHKNLAAGRWFELSLAEQLGNIGSEYYRACKSKGQNNDRFKSAVQRTLELCELTRQDSRWSQAQQKELSIMYEQVTESFKGTASPDLALQKYFDSFAILARK